MEAVEEIPSQSGEVVPIGRPFPPEVMKKILDNLRYSKDLINCSRAVPFFDDVLSPRKTVYLFSRVLPLLFGYLDLKDVLSCRLVCFQWLTTIKSFTEALAAQSPYDDDFHLSQMDNRLARRTTTGSYTRQLHFTPWVTLFAVNSLEQLPTFWTFYANLQLQNPNPFFGHALKLVFTFDDILQLCQNPDPRVTTLFAFFTIFGRHVWHLSLVLEPEIDILRPFVYCLLFYVLRYTPNLRSVTLVLLGSIQNPDRQFETSLQDLVPDDPFVPSEELRHLETLQVFHDPQTALDVRLLLVIPFIAQIRRLTLTHWDAHYVPTASLSNLVDLDLYCIRDDVELQAVSRIPAPQLQKLSLCFDYVGVDPVILNHVVTTFPLKVLQIEWTDPRKVSLGSTDGCFERRLPTLHTLYVMQALNVDYAFLRWFPNLQYLYLTEVVVPKRKHRATETEDEEVTIHRYLQKLEMNRSNVWKLLPKLKFVEYTRVRHKMQKMRLGMPLVFNRDRNTVLKASRASGRGGPLGAASQARKGMESYVLGSWAWEGK